MAVTPKLEIKQTASLTLTPQLRQAINLLQMSNIELQEFVTEELKSNPLLEREDAYLNDTSADNLPDNSDSKDEQFILDNDTSSEFDDSFSDSEGYNHFEQTSWDDYNLKKSNFSGDDNFDYFEQRLADKKSFYELIDEQIELVFPSQIDKLIAKILTEQLDKAGYFRSDINLISQKLKPSPKKITSVLNKLKTFEPSGIFAENLAECLKLQLIEKDLLSPPMEQLLTNLSLVGEKKFSKLCKLCDCTLEQLQQMLLSLKSLNPKPAADWFIPDNNYIIPDVFITRSRLGEYQVELNPLTLPKVLINQNYKTVLSQDKQSSRYLKQNLSNANFLIKALHQRAENILNICQEIVLRQYYFFEKGIEYLKPMTLKDIADALSLSESTVSRVTTNKYLSSPAGVFELKYFFSSAAGSYINNTNSSTKFIKHKIFQLVTNEDPKHILSDDTISELLASEGIKIARRTIAKYRESMSIPSSAERKRQKRS